ncbi:hypothetical protein [Gracilibacillus oryzae]|uniref:hypothetical protein n=1 Tax=Gracilibacillus oryzae TaxID=1672701 RepID=UPI001295F5B7|nr:hypothetical protein [Gracilibacillus oryzae]
MIIIEEAKKLDTRLRIILENGVDELLEEPEVLLPIKRLVISEEKNNDTDK